MSSSALESKPAVVAQTANASPVETIPADWEDFEAAAKRSIEQHVRNSFIHTYKPVLDDAGFRSFTTMDEYRQWCHDQLPAWLGFNTD